MTLDDDKKRAEWFATVVKAYVQSDAAADVQMRLTQVTRWLREAGVPDDAIMLGYFNEAMWVAQSAGDIGRAWTMASQLHLHVGRAVKSLRDAEYALFLGDLPPDPRKPQQIPANTE